MQALASCKSIIGNSTGPGYFSTSLKERLPCGPEIISYRRPRKLVTSGLQRLVSLRRGGIDLLSCLSSNHQADTENVAVENQDTNQSKTVRVKFQLQKQCTFDEQFLIVGDDPTFGSWDISKAIPLNWSDGHQWAAEVEIPVGKTIQFKFVLQGKTGNVVWQPGPDRTFQPWETTNTIIVSEDWDSAESQMLTEEEKVVNLDEDSPIVPEKLMIAENLTNPNKELIHDTNKELSVALADTSIAQNLSVESHRELIDGSKILGSEENGSNISASGENASNISLSEENTSNTSASKENAKAIVAENISYLKESFILDTSNKAVNEVYNNPNGETTFTSNVDSMITEGILKNDEKAATVEILRNTDVQESLINYGVPILVPGLPPTPTISDQAIPQHEVEYDVSKDGINGSNDQKPPENMQMNQKLDTYIVAEKEMETKSSYEEDYEEDDKEDGLQSEIRQENDVVQNDITWGHKTLMKFFSNLKLL